MMHEVGSPATVGFQCAQWKQPCDPAGTQSGSQGPSHGCTSRTVKEHGLNLSQWRVLAAVAEQPGRTAVEVVRITPMDKGIVSRATRGLLDLGLIRREASQLDGRLSHLFLTDAGADLYETLTPQVEAITLGVADTLDTTQQERLTAMLRDLMQVIPDLR